MVSIIIPVYNSAKFLEKCVLSVMAQTYTNIEVILIDDGSTDESGLICDDYARKDTRIRTFHIVNSGPSAARNFGIKEARGKFIQFVDADDYLESTATKKMRDLFERDRNIDLVICSNRFIKIEKGQYSIISTNTFSCGEKCTSDFLQIRIQDGEQSYVWGKLYLANVIKKNNISFPEKIAFSEDLVFNINYFAYTKRIYTISECLHNHVLHDRENHISALNVMSIDRYKELEELYLEISKVYRNNNMAECVSSLKVYLAYMIVGQFIRKYKYANTIPYHQFLRETRRILALDYVQDGFKLYKPEKGSSRVIPFLFRLKLPVVASIYLKLKFLKNRNS